MTDSQLPVSRRRAARYRLLFRGNCCTITPCTIWACTTSVTYTCTMLWSFPSSPLRVPVSFGHTFSPCCITLRWRKRSQTTTSAHDIQRKQINKQTKSVDILLHLQRPSRAEEHLAASADLYNWLFLLVIHWDLSRWSFLVIMFMLKIFMQCGVSLLCLQPPCISPTFLRELMSLSGHSSSGEDSGKLSTYRSLPADVYHSSRQEYI